MKNFVFLSIDDLNDWVGGLGGYSGTVHTPNLDKMMTQGTTFSNAFSQAAICNPSRASVLTGKEPQKTGIFNNQKHQWEAEVSPKDTIFGAFKEAGYYSKGVGKLFHTGASEAATAVMFDDYRYMGKDNTGVNLDGKPVGPYTGTDTLADERRADHIVEYLNNYTPGDAPLMLSVGLLKPHTDWVVPQKYFDLYPIDEIQIDAVAGDRNDIPPFVLNAVGQKYPWSADDVPDEMTWKKLIQAYLATISFMDAQVGKIIDAVDNSAIANNTAVVLWSDHGYHLGDKDFWHKFTLWDNAARAPVIIRDPGTVPADVVITDAVELLDIFPTMLDMAGISADGLELDGKSLTPYFNGGTPAGEPAAYTWMYGNVSLRTNDYRYSVYEDGSKELYDIKNDPELTVNLANNPAFAAVQATLAAQLKAKFSLIGYGEGGTDLVGTSGDDAIAQVQSGGTAAGGMGDDVYFVASGVRVVEQQGGGHDTIVTEQEFGSYFLPAFVENLEMRVWSDRVFGNNGDNVITANANYIDAKDGNDVVYAGNRSGFYTLAGGNDEIFGGAGDDTIFGGTGNDTLHGEAGSDEISGDEGNDSLTGGGGNDTLVGGVGNDTLQGGANNDSLRGGIGNDVLDGGSGNDTLLGEDGEDVLRGGGGNDVLSGGDGNDTLDGGTFEDWIFGGAGDDSIMGSAGLDNLYGGVGNDTILGGAQADKLVGEYGNDVLSGGDGNDTLIGNQNEDWLFGGAGNDSLMGDEGLDHLFGGVGDDTLIGGANNDTLVGEYGDDVLSGGDGDDNLDGNDGVDWMFGGFGNDSMRGGADADNLFGGLENDTLFGGTGNDKLNGEQGNDVVSGEAGNDTGSGGDGVDWMFGGAGNDSLSGDAGDDNMFGGLDNDTLFGGTGDDKLNGEQGNDVVSGEAGNDTGSGGDGVDWMFGGAGNDSLSGDAGDDNIFGGLDNDTLIGGTGNDKLHGEQGNDVLSGGEGNDTLDGGSFEDWLFGGAGNDLIFGGDGFDNLYGSLGNDTLSGGAQADVLTGEIGSDVFIFSDGFGADRVTDFEALNDYEKIDLRGLTEVTDFADLTANHMSQSGGDVLITAGGDVLTLTGVSLDDLDANDFIF
ncbi:MAG: sulfatase-like hydrolase/transferase [Sulfitobacter sp.]